jgi:hypothetical protein
MASQSARSDLMECDNLREYTNQTPISIDIDAAGEKRAKSKEANCGEAWAENAVGLGLNASKHASKRVDEAQQGKKNTKTKETTTKEELIAIVRGLEEEGIESTWLQTLWGVIARVPAAGSTRDAPRDGVEKRLEAIEKTLNKLATPTKIAPPIWADIAAKGTRVASAPQVPTRAIQTNRHTVRVSMPTSKGKAPEDILKEVKKTFSTAVAIRVLHSGDIDVTLPDEASKDRAQTLPSTQSLQVHRRDYLVSIDGVPLSTRVASGKHEDNTQLAEAICEASRSVAPAIHIARIEWLYPLAQVQRMREAGKSRGTLIVGFPTESMRRSAIQGGLVIGAQLFDAGYFDRTLQEKQCYNCHQWGHIGKACVKQARCGRCAGAHITSLCKETKLSCAACGKSHAAWHRRECQAYQRHHDDITRLRIAARAHTASIRAAPKTHIEAQPGWTTVPSKRQREVSPKPTILRRVGRPTAIETASRDAAQTRIEFAGIAPANQLNSGEAMELTTSNE